MCKLCRKNLVVWYTDKNQFTWKACYECDLGFAKLLEALKSE